MIPNDNEIKKTKKRMQLVEIANTVTEGFEHFDRVKLRAFGFSNSSDGSPF